MKKIVFFIGNMSHSGGTERVLSVVAGGLAERGFQVTVLSLWGRGPEFFALNKMVKIIWVEDSVGEYNIIKQLCYLTRILREEKPDFLVDVDSVLGIYSLLLKRMVSGLRWISWEHFSCRHHFTKNALLRKFVKQLVYRYSDQMIVLTEADMRYYCRHYKLKCGITCIGNPLPYQTEFHKQTERPIIIAAGRLTAVKGFDLLIRSWSMLESRYPEWSVLVAGEGEDRRQLESAAAQEGLKRIHFIGNVAPIEDLYKKAAFFVLPSRNEGFGMVLIEAMHFALPAVSYACASGPKEIVRDGVNGFLIEKGNVIEFASKMELFIKNEQLRRQMGEKAAKSIRRYERDKILDRWVKLLRAVYDREGSGKDRRRDC